ncbi:unnamed protein product [Heligmosomoides polygyrus]|uniref:EVE domain-containing protein n=1 Tax=Heligmosomoides polygyrus TaxID=6339 RepID=A0A183GIJ7_HELPZ|nr:unnamed protein product [Heligmosomoides polygyrus]
MKHFTRPYARLARVSSDGGLGRDKCRPSPDPRIEEHFIGVRTSHEAEKMVKADDFVLYYRRDEGPELEISIPLYLAHRNTRNKAGFH